MLDAIPNLLYNPDSKTVLRCRDCSAPFAYLVLTPMGYAILIVSHHHGEKHENLFLLPVAPKEGAPDG